MSYFRSLFDLITVKEVNDKIIVSGFNAPWMTRDIQKVWRTSKINQYMFIEVQSKRIVLPSFFALEFYYILDQILAYRGKYTKVKVIKKIQAELKENTWLKSVDYDYPSKLDWSRLKLFDYTPKDYQRNFFEHYDRITQQYQLSGYVLAGAPGAGKSMCCLMMGEMLHADKLIILCPKNALNKVWETELLNRYLKPRTYWLSNQGKEVTGTEYAHVFHYEAMDNIWELIPLLQGQKITFVIDESHNFNEIKSQRTQKLIELIDDLDPSDVIPASGTPIKSIGSEAVPLLSLICPAFRNPDVQERFSKIFGRNATKALDIIKHRLGLMSFKIEKKELGLTDPILETIKIKIPNGDDYTLDSIRIVMTKFIEERTSYYRKNFSKYQNDYDEGIRVFESKMRGSDKAGYEAYKKAFKIVSTQYDPELHKEEVKFCNQFEQKVIMHTLDKDLKLRFKDAKSVVKYLDLKVMGEALGRILGGKRAQCHVDMLPYIPFEELMASTEKKTVVFTSYVRVVEQLAKELSSKKYIPIAVYGKTNNELAANVSKFDKNPDINPLIATYPSLSTAVPLVMADVMIATNPPFRTHEWEQAVSRLHRLGQTSQVRIYTMMLDTGDKPNISTRTIDIVKWSQDQIEKIMGIKSPYEINDDSTGFEDFESQQDEFSIWNEIVESFEGYTENNSGVIKPKDNYLIW